MLPGIEDCPSSVLHGANLSGTAVEFAYRCGLLTIESAVLVQKHRRGQRRRVVVSLILVNEGPATEGPVIPLHYVSLDDTYHLMIQSAKGKLVNQVLAGKPGKGFPNDIFRAAVRKLAMLEAAVNLDDLRLPPGNRLEALSDDREGQHSIRINDQWRICFVWADNGPEDVEIVDYH
jgi:proteic killer suppression protein